MVKESKKKKKSTWKMGRKPGYHKISDGRRFHRSKKNTQTIKRRIITSPKNTNKQIENQSNSLEENYSIKLKSGNLEEAFNFIDEIVDSIKNSELSPEKNPNFKLLIKISKDKELNKIIRLKVLSELRKLDLKMYIECAEEILRNISEKIEFKINTVKIVDKTIRVISQGDSYILGKGSIINFNKTKKKLSYFIDPKYC